MKILMKWYSGLYGPVISVALGDSPNDFEMLEAADIPVLIRSSKDFSRLGERLPRLRITDLSGPEAWNSVILEILKNN
jgi:mannosyl-3-phosphoglycerate phosphatase